MNSNITNAIKSHVTDDLPDALKSARQQHKSKRSMQLIMKPTSCRCKIMALNYDHSWDSFASFASSDFKMLHLSTIKSKVQMHYCNCIFDSMPTKHRLAL